MKKNKSVYGPEERVDTYEVVQKMTSCIGGFRRGNMAKTARIYGTSPTRLRSILKRRVPAPTLDTLVIWAHKLYIKTGVRVVLTATPDFKLYYAIIDARHQKIEGVIIRAETSL